MRMKASRISLNQLFIPIDPPMTRILMRSYANCKYLL